MIVFIAGMPRSGSTFAFNIVRELLTARGTVHQEAIVSLAVALAEAPDAEHVIIKAHAADEATVDAVLSRRLRTICTIREPVDAVASWMEAFDPDLDRAIALFKAWFVLYELIRAHTLTVSYEQIDTNPLAAALDIGRYVVPSASEQEIEAIVARHTKAEVFARTRSLAKDAPGIRDVGFSYYDSATFYHRRHVASIETRTAADRIGAEAVEWSGVLHQAVR